MRVSCASRQISRSGESRGAKRSTRDNAAARVDVACAAVPCVGRSEHACMACCRFARNPCRGQGRAEKMYFCNSKGLVQPMQDRAKASLASWRHRGGSSVDPTGSARPSRTEPSRRTRVEEVEGDRRWPTGPAVRLALPPLFLTPPQSLWGGRARNPFFPTPTPINPAAPCRAAKTTALLVPPPSYFFKKKQLFSPAFPMFLYLPPVRSDLPVRPTNQPRPGWRNYWAGAPYLPACLPPIHDEWFVHSFLHSLHPLGAPCASSMMRSAIALAYQL